MAKYKYRIKESTYFDPNRDNLRTVYTPQRKWWLSLLWRNVFENDWEYFSAVCDTKEEAERFIRLAKDEELAKNVIHEVE